MSYLNNSRSFAQRGSTSGSHAHGRSLGELNMLQSAKVAADGSVSVEVELATPAYPQRERIAAAIQSRVAEDLPAAGQVQVSFSADVKGKNAGGAP